MTTTEEPTRLEKVKGMHRSVSQIKQYQQCGYAYYLQRVEQVWQRPAAWLPQGLGVHEAAEAYERANRDMTLEEMQQVYKDSYETHTNRLLEDTPNTEWWFRSGPYQGEVDISRRFTKGLEQTVGYVDYYEKHRDEVIWIAPDGQPGIELEFDVDLDGVKTVGFIDQVIQTPDDVIRVRDIKTGNKPGDDFQLAVYAVVLNQQHETAIDIGDYWMGRISKPTHPFILDQWPRNRVADVFGEVDAGIKAESFEPSPEESKCMFCSVASSCEFRFVS